MCYCDKSKLGLAAKENLTNIRLELQNGRKTTNKVGIDIFVIPMT